MASSSDPLADFEDGDDMDSFPPPGDEGKNLFQLWLLIPAITVVIYGNNNSHNLDLAVQNAPHTWWCNKLRFLVLLLVDIPVHSICIDATLINVDCSCLFFLDICRVCRSGPSPGKPLFHPCLCTGSIKFVHQDWYVTVLGLVMYSLVARRSERRVWYSNRSWSVHCGMLGIELSVTSRTFY